MRVWGRSWTDNEHAAGCNILFIIVIIIIFFRELQLGQVASLYFVVIFCCLHIAHCNKRILQENKLHCIARSVQIQLHCHSASVYQFACST